MRPLDTTFLMLLSLFTALRLVNAHAAPDSITLPTLTVMADRELREETGITDIEILDVLRPCFAAVALSDIQNQLVALKVSCSSQTVPCPEENENIIPGFYDREQTRRLLENACFSSRAQLAAYLYAKGMLDASLL